MTERSPTEVIDEHNTWQERSMRVKARLESERKERFFRIISGVHGFSALALAMANAGELLGAGAIRWPWWYSCMLAAAVILPAASGASAWFRSAQSIKFRFLASASAMAPLAFAGYYTSPILWANVLVLCALIVFLARQSRANADGQQPPS